MCRLAIISLCTFIFLTLMYCSNIDSKNLLIYEGFSYKTVAITIDNYQNHTIYIRGFDPKERQDIINIAKLLVCYSKSAYIKESMKFYDYRSGKSTANLNLPIGSIYIVSKWVDDFKYINKKKIIASINLNRTDTINLKIFDNSFPHAKVIYSLSDLGIDYYSQVCN